MISVNTVNDLSWKNSSKNEYLVQIKWQCLPEKIDKRVNFAKNKEKIEIAQNVFHG